MGTGEHAPPASNPNPPGEEITTRVAGWVGGRAQLHLHALCLVYVLSFFLHVQTCSLELWTRTRTGFSPPGVLPPRPRPFSRIFGCYGNKRGRGAGTEFAWVLYVSPREHGMLSSTSSAGQTTVSLSLLQHLAKKEKRLCTCVLLYWVDHLQQKRKYKSFCKLCAYKFSSALLSQPFMSKIYRFF